MAKQIINVPDIGGADNVDIIEICVAVGDTVSAEDSLLVLESDKASMEVPSPVSGKVVGILVKEGGKVSEGDAIFEIEAEGAADAPAAEPAAAPAAAPAPAAAAPAVSSEQLVKVPDIGGSENVEVIELCVAVGDEVAEGDSIIVLESDKASMEVPAPASGKVVSFAIKEGDKLSEGDDILVLEVSGGAAAPAAAPAAPAESAPAAAAPAPAASGGVTDVNVPDIGGSENVEVIEVCVAEGDEISEGDSDRKSVV